LDTPAHPHGLDQIVDRACRKALHVRFLDDGGHGLFRRTARFQEVRKIRPLAQLRDPDIHRPGTRLPRPGTVSIAVVHPLRAALVGARAAQLVDVQRHQAISNEAQHLGQQLSVRRL
jgi:hypothetical protein